MLVDLRYLDSFLNISLFGWTSAYLHVSHTDFDCVFRRFKLSEGDSWSICLHFGRE